MYLLVCGQKATSALQIPVFASEVLGAFSGVGLPQCEQTCAPASFVLNNIFVGSNFTDKKQNRSFYFRIWYRDIEAEIGEMQLKGEII